MNTSLPRGMLPHIFSRLWAKVLVPCLNAGSVLLINRLHIVNHSVIRICLDVLAIKARKHDFLHAFGEEMYDVLQNVSMICSCSLAETVVGLQFH